MTLVTTPLNVAESYCSVADADTYHSNRGNSAWAALTTAQKEEALRKATQYIEGEYYGRWTGDRVESDQSLSLPRLLMPIKDYGNGNMYYAYDSIPTGIIRACAELALKSRTVDLIPDVERAMIRDKVDVLETEWSPYSSQVTQYRAIDAMLAPYLIDGSGGANHRVIRS